MTSRGSSPCSPCCSCCSCCSCSHPSCPGSGRPLGSGLSPPYLHVVLGVKPRAHGVLDPPDGGAGKDESEGSREIAQTTNKIHHSSPTLCCRSEFSSSLLGVAAVGAFSSPARASSRSGESGTSRSDASRARRERTGRRPKPTRREHNASRNYRQLHTGETPDPLCPCAIDCRARELRFCRQHAIFLMCRVVARASRRCANKRIAAGTSKTGGIDHALI